MITCKEDLINTYIENDFGELRDLYIKKAIELGVKTCERGRFEYLLDKVTIGVRDWGYGAQLEWNNRCFGDAKYLTLSDLKPPTKVVYEKVNFSSVGECVQSVHDNYGEYFFLNNGTGEYQLAEYQDSAWYWKEDNIYIKVEKEIDWREEVHNKLQSDYHWSTPIAEIINDESDCFLELCRVALRATGELK